MPQPTRKGERLRLTLRLGDRWTVEDLAKLLNAINELYVVYSFLAEEHLEESKGPDALKRFLDRQFNSKEHRSRLSASGYQKRRRRYFRQLKIYTVMISSPGLLSLDGSGVFRELRELVKDLQWRNKAERQQHDLDLKKTQLQILKERIEIMERLGYPQDIIREIVSKSTESIEVLSQDIKREKIRQLPHLEIQVDDD